MDPVIPVVSTQDLSPYTLQLRVDRLCNEVESLGRQLAENSSRARMARAAWERGRLIELAKLQHAVDAGTRGKLPAEDMRQAMVFEILAESQPTLYSEYVACEAAESAASALFRSAEKALSAGQTLLRGSTAAELQTGRSY